MTNTTELHSEKRKASDAEQTVTSVKTSKRQDTKTGEDIDQDTSPNADDSISIDAVINDQSNAGKMNASADQNTEGGAHEDQNAVEVTDHSRAFICHYPPSNSNQNAPVEEKQSSKQTLEEGHLYFFYRTKVGEERAESVQDIQRTFMLLKPNVSDDYKDRKNRLVVIGRKMLPSVKDNRPFWCYVEHAAESMDQVTDYLQQNSYDTATLGHRVNEPAKLVAEGVYSIIADENNYNTYLVIMVTVPTVLGEVQQALNILKEGSYILSIKNPQASNTSGNGNNRGGRVATSRPDPHYTEELTTVFAGRRFIPANPPTFLDYDNCELLLIPSQEGDVVGQFDEEGEELFKLEQEDEKQVLGNDKMDSKTDKVTEKMEVAGEKVLDQLGLDRQQFDTAGLQGKWEE